MSEAPPQPQAILFIASRSTIGGGEIYLLDVLQWLDRSRFLPVVVLPQPGPFGEKLADLGVETLTLGVDYGWLQPPAPWYSFLADYESRVRRLVAFIQRRGVALVHTNSNQVFEGAVAARLAGVHHVHVVHIPFQAHLPIWQRVPIEAATFASWVDELSSAIVAVAEPVAASLSPPADRRKIRVIHNGLDLDRYRGARAAADGRVRRELGIPAGAVLVTGVGRLHPDKGFDTFIEIAAQVAALRPNTYFVIAGGTDDEAHERSLREAVWAHGLGARVQLVGFRNDVPELLAESDLFLLTSRSEGGPYVLIEAIACGCACVASRCGGFVEHVMQSDASGQLFEPGDAATAVRQVLALLDDCALRDQQLGAAQAIVSSGEFDVRQSVRRLAQVYDDVFALPPPAAGAGSLALLLQLASELGSQGAAITDVKERMKRIEHAANLVLDNPLAAAVRRLKGWRGKR